MTDRGKIIAQKRRARQKPDKTRIRLPYAFISEIYCRSCHGMMPNSSQGHWTRRWIACGNPECKLYDVRYEMPRIQLVPYKNGDDG